MVHTFLFKVTEEILTPVQEAWLDSQLHPWHPDVWTITNQLAAHHGLPPVSRSPFAMSVLMPLSQGGASAAGECLTDLLRHVRCPSWLHR